MTIPAQAAPEVEALAYRLAQLLAQTSAESQYHLATALGAAGVPGVGGSLVIEIPRRVGEHVVVKWAGGAQQLSLPL